MPESADSSVLEIGEKSQMGVVKRTDDDISAKNLSEIEEEVATSNDFIVYGRASVEVFDDDTVSQKIEMDAFEESLEQFFAQGGNISYQHKDVMVGEALEEYELTSDVSIQIGDEEKSFSEGDVLETKVEDDTLWLVANIYGRDEPAGSDASVMTRLGAYRGDLDGFSVTIKNKEYRNTSAGQVISDIDFHSVTVGTGDQIKNPDSLFGVAEFKLRDHLTDALNLNTRNMEMNILKKLRSSSTEAMGEETISHALSETYDLGESAKAIAGDEAVDDVEAKAVSRLEEVQEKAEDRDDLVALLSDMTDLPEDEVTQALDEMLEDTEQEGEYEDEEEDEDVEEDDGDMEEEADTDGVEAHAEAIADEMDVPVSAVMEVLSAVDGDEPDEVEEDVEEEADADSDEDEMEEKSDSLTEEDVEEMVDAKLEEAVDEIGTQVSEMEEEVADSVAERVSEKLTTGSTPESDANPADDGTRNLLDEW